MILEKEKNLLEKGKEKRKRKPKFVLSLSDKTKDTSKPKEKMEPIIETKIKIYKKENM